MNIEAWQKLRESVADESKPFDMDAPCRCLFGHAEDLAPGDAEDILGLNYMQVLYVYLGRWIDKGRKAVTRADALRYLDAAIAAQDPMVTI